MQCKIISACALSLVIQWYSLPAFSMSTIADIETGDISQQSVLGASHEIPATHWSYKLVQKLASQTGLDAQEGSIRVDGTRPLSRTEMAVLITDISDKLASVPARQDGAEIQGSVDVSERDKGQFEVLQEEFTTELRVLKGRIEQVEGSVQHLSEKVHKIAIDDDAYVHVGKLGKAQLYGQIHAWNTLVDENEQKDKNIRLRRANIGVRGQVAEDWQYNVMFDPARSDKILKDLWLEYTGIPHHSVRIGQYRVLTYDASARSSSRNYTFERTQIGQIANIREQGMSLLGKWKYLDYHLGMFNGDGDNERDENSRQAFGGRVVVRPLIGLMDEKKWGKLELGGSVFEGQAGPIGAIEDRDRYALEARYQVANVELNSEYLHFEDPGDIIGDGWYLEGVYKVTPKWHLVARYDTLNQDKALVDGKLTEYIAGVNYLLSDYNVRLGLFYRYLDDEADLNEGSSVTMLVQHTF